MWTIGKRQTTATELRRKEWLTNKVANTCTNLLRFGGNVTKFTGVVQKDGMTIDTIRKWNEVGRQMGEDQEDLPLISQKRAHVLRQGGLEKRSSR